jgi:DNA-binding MarR family transcriptional regulator
MPDVNLKEPKSGTNPLYLRESELRAGIELLFFAYRDFTSDPDNILKGYNFGRAHHRVIHFVGRNPGITVADLLKILRITKQSLGRVLKQLIEDGFIERRKGSKDRRQRLLYLTETGVDLEHHLSAPQKLRVARAYREAGPKAVAGYRKVLASLINDKERDRIIESIERS